MFTEAEYQVIKLSLDAITIKGSDAKLIANLQDKLIKEINNIQKNFEAGPPEPSNQEKNKKPTKK